MLALLISVPMINTRDQQLFFGCVDAYKYNCEPFNHTSWRVVWVTHTDSVTHTFPGCL